MVWYRRPLELEPPADGESIKLHFGAVDYATTVYVDGELVGDHVGGMTPFSVDITRQLRAAGPHRLTLRVHDNPLDVTQPRGKQDWRTETHGIFYHRTTGIWQQVWAERVGVDHVADLAWSTDLDAEQVLAEVVLASTDDLRDAEVTRRADPAVAPRAGRWPTRPRPWPAVIARWSTCTCRSWRCRRSGSGCCGRRSGRG